MQQDFSTLVGAMLRTAEAADRSASVLGSETIIIPARMSTATERDMATLRDAARSLRSAADSIDAVVRFVETGDRSNAGAR